MSGMHFAVVVLAGLAGTGLVGATVLSAAQTLAVPRGTPVRISRWVIIVVGAVLGLLAARSDYRARDRLMALYAPLALLCLPVVWLALVLVGFTLVFWASGQTWDAAFLESGSSLSTLGFKTPGDLPAAGVAFAEAVLGLGLLALLISYLPSIYASYSRREAMVTALETQAGSPPSGAELLRRLAQIEGLGELEGFWRDWARWFAELEETHTSIPSLVFFRSPQPDRSWITAAGAVLDGAAISMSSVESDRLPEAALCVRSGYLALRNIADFFSIPFDPDPRPDDPISVSRDEFDQAFDQ